MTREDGLGISRGPVLLLTCLFLVLFFTMMPASVIAHDPDDDDTDDRKDLEIISFDNVTGDAGTRFSLVATLENKRADDNDVRISVKTDMPGVVDAPEKVHVEEKSIENITIWLVPENGTVGMFNVTLTVSWNDKHQVSDTAVVTVSQVADDRGDEPGAAPVVLTPAQTVALGVGAGFGLLALGLLVGTEWGRYALLGFIVALPLYTRLKRDHLMDHVHRAKLLKFIEASPGTHFSEIRRKLDLHNGVLAYHIKALERENLIVSKMDGQYRRFYPVTMSVPRKEIEDLTWHQLAILDVIRKRPGIMQKEISQDMGESKQVVNYHLRGLVEMGIVVKEEEGRETYYTADEKRIYELSKKSA